MSQQFILFFLFFTTVLNAQISGTITDEQGEILPFASVYVQGTSRGTTSNIEGNYSLDLSRGKYNLVFQYVGYQQLIKEITLEGKSSELDIQLLPEAMNLTEIIVRSNAEDPAYRVIREAIKKRSYYQKLVQGYACQSYIKGQVKIKDAPEKILGQDVGDFQGSLDSTRQGIVYLSESQSNYYFQQPDTKKEVMISSKVSGDFNGGVSWNSASDMELSFYDNYTPLGRQVISPIAESALSYYRYELIGTLYDEEGRLINKIKVIPKRGEDPVYSGNIYIVEDLWLIQSVDVFVDAAAMKQPGIDSVHIRQVHVPVEAPDVWLKLSQSYTFEAGAFGFKTGGTFAAVFTDYEVNPDFPDGFFTNEVFKVEMDASARSQVFWDSIRPMPLTQEEQIDYVRKDSIKLVIKSKPYLDSVDQVRNKFKFGNLLTGYTYQQSHTKKYFQINSPLTTVQFNPVQGWYGAFNMTYRREYDDENLRWWEIEPELTYSFAEERWRGTGRLTYNFNRTNYAKLTLSGGTKTQQFNAKNPIHPTVATGYALLGNQNLIKLYDKSFGQVEYRHEVANGVLLFAEVEYARRRPLILNSQYTWRDDVNGYESNHPTDDDFYGVFFQENSNLRFRLDARLRLKQKYTTYPTHHWIQGSSFPDLWVGYEKAIKIEEMGVAYDKVTAEIRENYLPIGLVGYSEFRVGGGLFLQNENAEFIDHFHFNGNETFIGNPSKYNRTFKRLPYYDYSTNRHYLEAHYEHNFESFLLDKIPGVSKLGFSTVVGANYLYTPDRGDYLEVSLGLDNLGFGLFRFLRVDAVASWGTEGYDGIGWLIGFKLPTG
ncbi:MAG: DUF5686 and carboxypeptidase regulatory-like domain-containing protein [Saprospiraceae bacterium]